MFFCCAYCERLEEELGPGKKLRLVHAGKHDILLCDDCRGDRSPLSPEELDELIYVPVDVDPGVDAIDHLCLSLLPDGVTVAPLRRLVDLGPREADGFRYGRCPHCKRRFRSAADASDDGG